MATETNKAAHKTKSKGIKGSLERLLEKVIDYLDALLLYAQKHTEIFLTKLIIKGIWFVLAFFTICIGFAYISHSIYLSYEKFGALSPIQASLATGFSFLLVSFLFLRFLLGKF